MLALKKPQQTHFEMMLKLGLDRTGHMSFLTGQGRTPKFARQVLPDRTESRLVSFKHFSCQAGDISSHKISSLDTNLV